MQIIQVLLLGAAALLFFLGALRYDFGQLLGFKQIREKTTNKGITGACELDTSGVLSIVRHPWYLATILLIWARPVDISIIVANVMLTCYLVIGTYLEEKKLILEFGENYRSYQRRVSMLVPIKWIRSKIQT